VKAGTNKLITVDFLEDKSVRFLNKHIYNKGGNGTISADPGGWLTTEAINGLNDHC
jgi:hypothetical protein